MNFQPLEMCNGSAANFPAGRKRCCQQKKLGDNVMQKISSTSMRVVLISPHSGNHSYYLEIDFLAKQVSIRFGCVTLVVSWCY